MRDEGGAGYGDGGVLLVDFGFASSVVQSDPNALGMWLYLEGVDGIDAVNFERFQVGREGKNSLKISALLEDVDENGEVVASNAGEVTVSLSSLMR